MINDIKLSLKSLRVKVGLIGVSILTAAFTMKEQTVEFLQLFVDEPTAITITMIGSYVVTVLTSAGLIYGAVRPESDVPLRERI